MTRRMMALALVCVLPAASAWATPQDYCEAYALDFADKLPKADAAWPARHSNALEACLLQFRPPQDAKPRVQKPRKPKVAVAKPPVVKPKPPVSEEEIAVEETLPEPAVIVAPDIAPPTRKSASSANAETTSEPGKKPKTLFARLFQGKPKPVEKGALAPGSAAWLTYCENKYASFNRDTGKYTSFKGVERACKVTD